MTNVSTAQTAPLLAELTQQLHPRIAGPLRFNLATTVFQRDPGHDWRIAGQRLVVAFAFVE